MKVSYLILNYNSRFETTRLIKEISRFDRSNTIIVVDNFSDEIIIEEDLKAINENVHLLRAESNLGYARGNNLGLEYIYNEIDSKYVLVCNPDIFFTKDNVNKMIENIRKKEDVALSGLLMTDQYGNAQVSAWKLPTLLQDFVMSSAVLKKIIPMSNVYKNNENIVDVIQGAFFLADMDKFKSVNFFDDRTFLYGEERLVGLKLKNSSLKIFYDNSSSFIHEIGSSINKSYPNRYDKFKLLYESRLIYHSEINSSRLYFSCFKALMFAIGVEKRVIDFMLEFKAKFS
ncbi:glycosyltransferase family 2 protein [Vibrio fluvialis]|nr:glycosyltransferase family 2 protein [Vibrio fluvialis]